MRADELVMGRRYLLASGPFEGIYEGYHRQAHRFRIQRSASPPDHYSKPEFYTTANPERDVRPMEEA